MALLGAYEALEELFPLDYLDSSDGGGDTASGVGDGRNTPLANWKESGGNEHTSDSSDSNEIPWYNKPFVWIGRKLFGHWGNSLKIDFAANKKRLSNTEFVGKGQLTAGGRFSVNEGTSQLIETLARGNYEYLASAGSFVRLSGPMAGWQQSAASRRTLRGNLGIADGSGLYAHHIVPGGHHRAELARSLLTRYQIDINDAVNGVPLTFAEHYQSGLHSYDAIDAVTRRLERAIEGIDDWATAREALIEELQRIGDDILNDRFPPK
ncbi:MAG: hypothetical protein KatS3mg111_0088 [Pirellulaceae bacterium]|nr:MAG: hypothetical protein KatS3mg111_0088 [Pirellulaceae bacterium]